MTTRERNTNERAVRSVAEEAGHAYELIEQLHAVGFRDGDEVMLAAKTLRLELLKTKGDLERELSGWVLDCRRCNRRVHWVSGVGPEPGHWAHAEPAPGHDPVIG
jgi:hypothetical protein